jgi:hypothetical protein
MAILFLGSILLSVFSAWVVSNTVAISTHPGCGIFTVNGSNDSQSFSRSQKYYHSIEEESAEYARQCYNTSGSSDSCTFFYKQSIPVFTTHNTTCPFQSKVGDLCFDGSSSAFTLSTGRVNPEIIGINTPLKYTFQRDTTCSPLRMDENFIRPFIKNKTLYYRYFYGSRKGDWDWSPEFTNCTFEVGSVLNVFSPSYMV